MSSDRVSVEAAKKAALDVLLYNASNSATSLPRTAAWGYPEPYTRDLMICSLGVLVSRNEELMLSLRRVLETLAENQSTHGHIPGLVDDPEDRGSSDTTPLFLVGLSLYRRATGERSFLEDAAQRALTWMEYQSPDDRVLVAQQPTSDWRDEQWVAGYGLFVNALVYTYLRLFGLDDKAKIVR
jgi:glycogen debranching enzyme